MTYRLNDNTLSNMPESVRDLASVFQDGDLDDLVHDVYSREATAVNNGGQEAQQAFLLVSFFTPGEIAAITDRDALDETVHVVHSDHATEVNNGGKDEQLAFLLEHGYTPVDLLNARPLYEVVCGNIGTVYHGRRKGEARAYYREYVALSKNEHGRAAQEQVTLFKDGEPEEEYLPDELQQ